MFRIGGAFGLLLWLRSHFLVDLGYFLLNNFLSGLLNFLYWGDALMIGNLFGLSNVLRLIFRIVLWQMVLLSERLLSNYYWNRFFRWLLLICWLLFDVSILLFLILSLNYLFAIFNSFLLFFLLISYLILNLFCFVDNLWGYLFPKLFKLHLYYLLCCLWSDLMLRS